MPPPGYPANYLEAKDAFIVAARDIADELQTVYSVFDPHELVELDTDVAWIGNSRPKHLIIHIAGTHGVEALPGSAIQLDLLKKLPDAISKEDGDVAIIFVHVLNPYGTHHLRWSNENNVNLMSNWTTDPETLKGAPKGYSKFVDKTLLNTPSAPSNYWSSLKFKSAAAFCACTMGIKALTTAVSFPQYVNPEGIFFGGNQVEEVIEAFGQYLEKALHIDTLEYVTVIDVHTGIGDEYGGSQVMTLRGQGPEASERVKALRNEYPLLKTMRTLDPTLFKNSVFEYVENLVRKSCPRAKFLGLHQDFGTFNGLSNIEALSLENRHYHYSKPDAKPEDKRWKTKKTNEWRTWCASFFAPEDPVWWDKVVRGGRELVETAIAIMSSGSGAQVDESGEGVRQRL